VIKALAKEGFAMNERLFPISRDVFERDVLPIIEASTKPLGGRPPKVDHYTCFCAMLKMMSVSLPWRDLPKEYGPWHTIYTRFKRWSENGLIWRILYELKQKKQVRMDIVFMDSTTVKLHRHGAGAAHKKGPKISAKTSREKAQKSI
jgi:transposase